MGLTSSAQTKSSPTQHPPQLPLVVWDRVIYHLRRPLPRPTGQNQRESIRQGDLAVMMRVCKLFNRLAAPNLYRSVVVDHLPSLIYNIDQPGVNGVRSKAHLLEYIEKLHLEYCEKFHLSYHDLMLCGGAYFSLACGTPYQGGLIRACKAECAWMLEGAMALGTVKRDFPLYSLATGAFLGSQFAVWRIVSTPRPTGHQPDEELVQAMRNTAEAIGSLALNPGRMAYFCQRAEYGPLRYNCTGPHDPSSPLWKGAAGLEHRAHIDMNPGEIPSMPGGNSRWYCAFPGMTKPEYMNSMISNLAHSAKGAIYGRETEGSRSSRHRRGIPEEDMRAKASVSVDVYLPANFMTQPVRDQIRQKFAEAVREGFELVQMSASQYNDEWRLKEICCAPTCEACGWCPDDIPAEMPVIDNFPNSYMP